MGSLRDAVRKHQELKAQGLLPPPKAKGKKPAQQALPHPPQVPQKPEADPKPTQTSLDAPIKATEPAKACPEPPKKYRLPDGAEMHATYHADEKRWHGTLTIGEKVYRQKRSGVHQLMHDLGRMANEDIEKQNGKNDL